MQLSIVDLPLNLLLVENLYSCMFGYNWVCQSLGNLALGMYLPLLLYSLIALKASFIASLP